MKYPSHCCQKCGEFIGWLGRLLRFTHKCNKKDQNMNNQVNINSKQDGTYNQRVGTYNQRVGTCSICGGDVVGFRGAWHATIPPHPDRCITCGAVRSEDVIKMTPVPTMFTTTTTTTEYK